MTLKSPTAKKPAEQVIKDIRRATRRHFSAEDKIRIVLDGLRGDASSLASCPRHDACRRHRRAVPQGRYRPEPVLRLVEGVCGSACKKDPVSGVIGVQKGPLISMV